jgi:hypothetical protein
MGGFAPPKGTIMNYQEFAYKVLLEAEEKDSIGKRAVKGTVYAAGIAAGAAGGSKVGSHVADKALRIATRGKLRRIGSNQKRWNRVYKSMPADMGNKEKIKRKAKWLADISKDSTKLNKDINRAKDIHSKGKPIATGAGSGLGAVSGLYGAHKAVKAVENRKRKSRKP